MDDASNRNVVLVGVNVDESFYVLELARHGDYDKLKKNYWKQMKLDEAAFSTRSTRAGIRHIMIQRSYLIFNKMPHEIKPGFIQYLKNGQVKNISGSEDVFPLLIEIGDTVAPNNDIDLANRILFVIKHYDGYGIVNSRWIVNSFRPTFWLRKEASANLIQRSIYSDSQWICYAEQVPNGEVWISEFPALYFKERDPRPKVQRGNL